ncbi:MAG: hypothetical protein KGY39_04135 [Anaerolineales bacterium]|nr:hypothetical protein [Anaerolineales bacterium]MBS3753477.1 hypothetical protein [Anaerolineales bacterium]
MEPREEFREKIGAQIEKLDAEIDLLKAKARKAKEEARLEAVGQIDQVDQKREELGEKVEEFKNSGQDAWQELKGGVNEAVRELKNSLDQVRSRF